MFGAKGGAESLDAALKELEGDFAELKETASGALDVESVWEASKAYEHLKIVIKDAEIQILALRAVQLIDTKRDRKELAELRLAFAETERSQQKLLRQAEEARLGGNYEEANELLEKLKGTETEQIQNVQKRDALLGKIEKRIQNELAAAEKKKAATIRQLEIDGLSEKNNKTYRPGLSIGK